MRYWLYEILTQLIIILGRLRKLTTKNRLVQRLDRVFHNPSHINIECCDCGLLHGFYPFKGDEEPYIKEFSKSFPYRIEGYKYKMRMFKTPPSMFNDERKS